MRLTLFYISLAGIESNFVFGPMVSFAIHVSTLDWVVPMIEVRVSVGGRVYQVRPKDVLTVVIENVRGKINEAR